MNELFNGINILELDAIPSIKDQQLIVELLVGMILEYKKKVRTETLTIILEEAHRYVPEEKSFHYMETRNLIELAVAEGRVYGLKFIVIDQTLSLLSYQVMANCGLKIVHRLDSSREIDVIAEIVGIQKDNIRLLELVKRMDTGQAIVSYPNKELKELIKNKRYGPISVSREIVEMPRQKERIKSEYGQTKNKTFYIREELRNLISQKPFHNSFNAKINFK